VSPPAVRSEAWEALGGSYARRRGAGKVTRDAPPPPPPEIIVQDFESLAVAATLGTNPAGVNAFREIVQAPSFGYNQLQHDHMAIVDLGGEDGKALRVRYDDGWFESARLNNGIAYLTPLPQIVEAATISFVARFNPGFLFGKGLKVGPGLGWGNRHKGPASGGSTTQPHAGSFRVMTRDFARVSPYLYDANGTNGIGLTTTPALVTTPDDNDKHRYEIDVVLNTANVDSGPLTDPVSAYVPPTVVEGVDYLANGQLALRVDEAAIYSATNRVLRKYVDTLITHMTWSWFRGGGDTSWNVTGGPCFVDMTEFQVIEL
jgi:hypothetical protein